MMARNKEHTLRYFLFLATAWSAALPCQAQGHVEPTTAAPSELRLEIRPRICERGVNTDHCQLEFLVRGAKTDQEICLYMDDGEEKLLACKSADGNWRHKAALPLTRSTRFFIRSAHGSASGAEAHVELASYVPAVRPRRRHAWFSL